MNRFYIPDAVVGLSILDPEESYHAVKVLRLQKNDPVQVLNGKGILFEGLVFHPDPRKCTVELEQVKSEDPITPIIHIAIAPTKNIDRFEFFLEKATELGVSAITPLLCEHSERKVLKNERLNRIVIASMKQCGRLWLPELNEMTSLKDFLRIPLDGTRCIAHCIGKERNPIEKICKGKDIITVLIGPEGDFSPSEVKLATESGFIPISLSSNILRTETAGVAACQAIISLKNI